MSQQDVITDRMNTIMRIARKYNTTVNFITEKEYRTSTRGALCVLLGDPEYTGGVDIVVNILKKKKGGTLDVYCTFGD